MPLSMRSLLCLSIFIAAVFAKGGGGSGVRDKSAQPRLDAACPFQPGDEWVGTYTAAQSTTDFKLVVQSLYGATVTAVWEFSYAGPTGQQMHAAYRVQGMYYAHDNRLALAPVEWVITPPEPGWQMAGLSGYVSENWDEFYGDVFSDATPIGTFKTSLSASCPFVHGDIWVGTYTAPQGTSEFQLSIHKVEARRITAVYEFSFGGLRGSFYMAGQYDHSTHQLNMEPVGWINQPNRDWDMLGLKGTVTQNPTVFSGVIFGTTFSFSATKADLPFASGDTWMGQYTAGGTSTTLGFFVESVDGFSVRVVYEFDAGAGTKGSFYIKGHYSPLTRQVSLVPELWIYRPGPEWDMLGLTATFSADQSRMAGELQTTALAVVGTFYAERNISPFRPGGVWFGSFVIPGMPPSHLPVNIAIRTVTGRSFTGVWYFTTNGASGSFGVSGDYSFESNTVIVLPGDWEIYPGVGWEPSGLFGTLSHNTITGTVTAGYAVTLTKYTRPRAQVRQEL